MLWRQRWRCCVPVLHVSVRRLGTTARHFNWRMMPRQIDIAHAKQVNEQRREKRQKASPSGNFSLHVLGNGQTGGPRGLLLHSATCSYLLGCSEGMQRVCGEFKTRLVHLDGIMSTSLNWCSMGGLFGMLLTLSSAGMSRVKLHSPPGLRSLLRSTSSYIHLKDFSIEFDSEPVNVLQDRGLEIRKVPLLGGSCKPTSSSSLVSDDGTASPVNHHHHHTDPVPIEKVYQHHVTFAYQCTLPTVVGNIDLQKCVELGLPPGPALGRLKAGEDVHLADGTIIRPCDVIPPAADRVRLLVLEVPSVDFLESLDQLFAGDWCQSSGPDGRLTFVAHMTPRHVFDTDEYRQSMRRLSPQVRHLVLNDNCSGLIGASPIKVNQMLGYCDRRLFPPLYDVNYCVSSSCSDGSNQNDGNTTASIETSADKAEPEGNHIGCHDDHSSGIIHPRCGWHIQLTPSETLLTEGLPAVSRDQFLLEMLTEQGVEEQVCKYSSKFNSDNSDNSDTVVYPQIVFLGTGSSMPSRRRNSSSILIRVSKSSCVLLDCGESTYSQLVRLYGVAGADQVLRRLSLIFVSHMHADHHIGLISLLERRQRALLDHAHTGNSGCGPCLLVAPRPIQNLLRMYQHVSGHAIEECYQMVDNESLLHSMFCKRPPTDVWLKLRLERAGIVDLVTCPVVHCPLSYGVRLTLKSPSPSASPSGSPPRRKRHRSDGGDGGGTFTVVYSGDTRPCPHLAQVGTGCDLLIHEATFEDGFVEEAIMNSHSTCSEAIGVGVKMRARHIVLTHFSQRYAVMPALPANIPDNVGVAFDNMTIDRVSVQRLPALIPLLQCIFRKELEVTSALLAKRKKRDAIV